MNNPEDEIKNTGGPKKSGNNGEINHRAVTTGESIKPKEIPDSSAVKEIAGFRDKIGQISQVPIKKISSIPEGQSISGFHKNHYEIALFALNAGVWAWDKSQSQLYWNQKCFEITGLQEGLASPDHLFDITHPNDKQRLKIMWSRITSANGYFDLAIRIILKGLLHWLKISGHYKKNDTSPELVFGAMVDITEEKEFQEKLLESRSLFQSVVDDQTELICRFDKYKILTFSNKAFRKFFNLNPNDEASFQLKSFFNKGDFIILTRALRRLSHERTVVRFSQKRTILNIKYLRVQWTIRAFFNKEKSITGYQFVGRDIAEIQLHRDALRKSENMFRLIAENSKDIISIQASDGKLEYISPSIQGLLGFSPNDVAGIRPYRKICSEDRQVILQAVRQLIQFSQPQLVAFRTKNADGQKIWFESMIQHEYDNKGEATGRTIAVTRNIQQRKEIEEEQKRVEDELKEANQTKDKFFTIIAHDLRSPFTSILGFSRLLNDDYHDFDDEDRKMMVQQILSSTEATYQLLDNLLAWAKSQLGRTSFNPEDFYIESLIKETIQQANAQALSKDITISFESNEFNIVFADINMTRVVLRNLISNAIKYSYNGSEIKISTRLKDGFIAIDIKDEGVGMEQSAMAALFSIGNTGESTKGTANEKGTGLGLILVKEYVERNGGAIFAQSEEGHGSLFEFTIPLFKEKDNT
jgi:PAS domain S-box-containing protein